MVKRLWLINSLFLIAFLTSCTPTTERLINAIDEGNLEKVQRLIDRGVLLNDTQSSMQPLERAILRRQFDIYIELLSHGADPNYPMQNGMMPFVYLVGAAQYDYLIPLIEAGASFNFERNGDHIAFYLIEQNQFNVIEALLRFGLDKDIENDWDHTLLGAALSNPDVNALEVLLLLESGFELLGTDSRGRRAYDLMMSRRPNNLIIEILTKSNISLSQITDPWSQLIYDWEEDNREEVAEFLRSRGVTIDPPGFFPLHIAVRAVEFEALKWFLKNGADPNRLDQFGHLPEYYTWNYGGFNPVEPGVEYWVELINMFQAEIEKYRSE